MPMNRMNRVVSYRVVAVAAVMGVVALVAIAAGSGPAPLAASAAPVAGVLPAASSVAAASSAASTNAASGSDAAPAAGGMDRLKSLVGKWEGKGPEGMPVTITFELAGEDSTVMERLSVGDMVTMYHQDGDHLMLTHYCAGNNQPRMRAKGLSPDGRSIAFKFHDVTNLASPDASYMKSLTITFEDADHITEEWTHLEKGKDAPLSLRLTRVK